jgi:hypothetical protein
VIASCFELIGSATSGVAVFAVGLVLAAHPIRFSPAVLVGTLARVTVQSAVLFALLHLLHVVSPFAREALVCCSFPPGHRGRALCIPVQSGRVRSRFDASSLDARFGNYGTGDPVVQPLIYRFCTRICRNVRLARV